MPSFRNVHKHEMDFLGGYISFGVLIANSGNENNDDAIGANFKDAMCEAR